MESESTLVPLLETALRKSLGDRYLVNEARCPGNGAPVRGDLVVQRRDDPKQLYVVELKMMNEGIDLPLAVASQTKRMIAENCELNPRLILATTSRVGNLLRQELDAQDVAVVQVNEAAQLTAGIAEVIRADAMAAEHSREPRIAI